MVSPIPERFKPRGAEQFDEMANLSDGVPLFRWLDTATLCKPVVEAPRRCPYGLTFRPRQNACLARDFTGSRDQAKPGC